MTKANQHRADASLSARCPQAGLGRPSPAPLAHEQRAQADATLYEDPPTQTVLAVRTLSLPTRSLDVLSRHEARRQRAYNQALDRLLRIHAAKQKNVDAKPIYDANK